AHCPLCETDLGIEGKERLETKYRQEIEAKTAARATTQTSLKNTQTRYLSLVNELKQEEEQISREMARARAQLASLEKDVDSARQAEAMLAIEQGKLSQVQMRLSANEYAMPEQELMGKLTVEIETVGYAKSKHQAVRASLSELGSYETRKRHLNETEIRIQAERQSLSQILDSIKELLGQQQTFEQRQGELKAELGSKSKRLGEVKRDYLSLAQAVDDTEKRWNSDKSRTTTQLAMTEKDMKQAEEARVALPAERDKLAEKEKCLAKHEYAQSEQRDLDDTMAEIRALGYDQSSHQETKKRLLSLETFETRKRQLDEAQVRIETERLSLSRTVETLAQQENQIRALEARERYLSVELSVLPEVVSKLRGAEESCRVLLVQERGCRERIAVSQEGINRCKALEHAKSEKEVLRAEDARQEGIFRELAEAFGKKGVPALLIEAALPELEIEANRLLSRMTDNRLNIKLETQRDSKVKKGDPIETLDIKISDELGTRDYEMYSGGEAFRINLALRIALSKLLARRSGAPLPTLVIDEGFGTQDSNGREKLVEAINSIQGDFEKILVITHIEELKDLFPVRIEVTKTSEGSTFRVVE
ncbi:MAG: exonuclease SbcC, partial [Dehalococcoidia bacterium]|nr:exonuclease SbcC [Dehalococcoidia bacterium]